MDIDPAVFKQLLKYVYTGEVLLKKMPNVILNIQTEFGDVLLQDLLAAADKYQIEKLKVIFNY